MNRRASYLPLTILLCLALNVVCSQPRADAGRDFLASLMKEKMPRFGFVFADPARYRLQVIYTRIDRDAKNRPVLTTFYYRNYPAEFTCPASMVKLPLSILTLERLNAMNLPGVTRDTRFSTDCTFRCQVATRRDPLARDSVPTLSSCITRALVVSDNDAYNRLYEFLGPQEINRRMRELGYANARIVQRFSPCDTTANRHTNGFLFYDEKGNIICRQPARSDPAHYAPPIRNMRVGIAYLDAHNRKVRQGMDFSQKNCLPLSAADDILKRLVFPELTPENNRFRITPADRGYLLRLLALRPAETGIPAYLVKKDYWDAYTNYLFWGCGENAVIPANVRVFNIVGQSYGFLSDCAYYADFDSRIEFFLSATIYVNKDGILNDGSYEYKQVGFPFLEQLGQAIVGYEMKRARKVKADLGEVEKLSR